MANTFYLLSTAAIPVSNLDGYCVAFLMHDEALPGFRSCLFLCRHDGTSERNSLLAQLLQDLQLSSFAPLRDEVYVGFLMNSLGRSEAEARREVWTFLIFGNASPLAPFTPGEIEVISTGSSDATRLVITTSSANAIQMPAALEVIDGGDLRDKVQSVRAFGGYYESPDQSDAEFEWEMNGTFSSKLKLPFRLTGVFEEIRDTLHPRLDLALQHLGTGSVITFNDRAATTSDNELRLHDSEPFFYSVAQTLIFRPQPLVLAVGHAGQQITGSNVQLRIKPNPSSMKVVAIDADAQFAVLWSVGQPPLILENVELHITEDDMAFQPTDRTATYVIPWDATVTTRLTFIGNNLRLQFETALSQLLIRLIAVSHDPFTLLTELSLTTFLTPQANLVYPVLIDDGLDVLPINTTFKAKYRDDSDDMVILAFKPNQKNPEWVDYRHLELTPPTLTSRARQITSRAPRFRVTSLDADLSPLLTDAVGRFDIDAAQAPIPDELSTPDELKVKVTCRLSTSARSDTTIVVGMTFDLITATLKTFESDGPEESREPGASGSPRPMYFIAGSMDRTLTGDSQKLDFGLFVLELPNVPITEFPSAASHHGIFDLFGGELIIDPIPELDEPLKMWVPGGLPIAPAVQNAAWEEQRWLLHLKRTVVLDNIPLRIGRKGVTLNAELQPHPIKLNSGGGLITDIVAEPLSESQDFVKSQILVKENKIVLGEIFARLVVPGTKDLISEVNARMSQGDDGKPHFSAGLRITGGKTNPSCDLRIGFFKARLSNPRFGVAWSDLKGWKISAIVDAELSVLPQVSLQNGMTELKGQDAIVVKDLDLLALSKKKRPPQSASLSLKTRKFEFSIFGIVGLRMDNVSINWNTDSNTIQILSGRAAITFGSGGGTRGGVSLGDAQIECSNGRVRLKRASGAGISLSVPGQFDFSGTVAWKDSAEASYFEISGDLTTFGGLKVKGFLRYGSDVKLNNKRVRQLAAFASRGNLNKPVPGLPAVVWQEGGLGGGYNVQLGNLSRNPTDREILAKIDSLEPADPDNWHFVRENGTYLSLVGKLVFTSQLASRTTVCGYVLSIVASIDTNKRILAAGKLWLFSSQKYADEHVKQPSIVAAMQMDLRRPAITLRAETRKGGAIQSFPQLKAILDRTDAVLVMRLTPNLFDIFLQRLTYQQEWLGVNFDFEASWRFSAFRETILQYVRAKVRGHLGDELRAGPGGFDYSVDLDAGLEFGGLIGREGIMTWGEVSMEIHASCSAFIQVEFSVPYVQWKGVRSSVKWRTVTETLTLPRQSIGLGLSGEYAFRGTGGVAAGARVKIHFDRNICGHNLSISPEVFINPDLLDDVRDHVRHFEAQIDRVAGQTNQVARNAAPDLLRAQRLLQSILRSQQAHSAGSDEPEEWLVIEDSTAGVHKWALIPTWSTPWLCPEYRIFEAAVDGSASPRDILRIDFLSQVTEITYRDENDLLISINPAWDHANWGTSVIVPQEAVGLMRDLYRLNALFQESAIKHQDLQSFVAANEQRTLRRASADFPDGYDCVVDHRPLQRLRDSLTDEDRLTLPASVYPFTFKPGSDPDYEKLSRQLAEARRGGRRVAEGRTAHRTTRGAILSLLVDELEGRGTGLFSQEWRDVLGGNSHVTAYIQNGQFPETEVRIKRSGYEETPARIIRIGDAASGDKIAVGPHDLRERIEPLRACQEFREKSSQATGGTSDVRTDAEVVIKLPIDFRRLFDAIPVDDSEYLKTTWFELIDHVRIFRQRPGEKEFVLVGDRIPLPAEVYSSKNQILLRPFVFADVLKISDDLRLRQDRFLEGIKYQIQIVPLGWVNRPASDFGPLTADFPPVEPFIPANRRVPGDLALIFDCAPADPGFATRFSDAPASLNARLVHATASADDTNFPLEKGLTHRDLELWYEPRVIRQSGFYGRSLELDQAASVKQTVAEGRQDRVSREASGGELTSPVGKIQIAPQKDEALPEAAAFAIRDGQVRIFNSPIPADEGARFYFRARGASPLMPLQELPVFLARTPDEPPISVPHLELISAEDLEPLNFECAPVEATLADPRHRSLIQWEHPSQAKIGGVEIEISDAQEHRILYARRIEVLEEALFREHQHDFSDASEWDLITANTDPEPTAGTAVDGKFKDYFWDDQRWFVEGGRGKEQLDCLRHRLCEFAKACSNADWQDYAPLVWEFWNEVARFQSDFQNDDGSKTRSAIRELKYGLIAQLAGLFPTPQANSFTALETEYVAIRTVINGLRVETIVGDSPTDEFDKKLDLLAARQLVALVEYRRSFVINAIEEPDRPELLLTDRDYLLAYARSGELRDTELTALKRALTVNGQYNLDRLPNGQLEREIFEQWLLILTIPSDATLQVLQARFPLSMWFLSRMVHVEVAVEQPWDEFHPGQITAKQLIHSPGPLVDFVGQISSDNLTGTGDDGDHAKTKIVPYCVALQELLQLTSAHVFEPESDELRRFQTRPHHSLGLQRSTTEELEKSAIEDPLVNYVPQEILDFQPNAPADDEDIDDSLAVTVPVEFPESTIRAQFPSFLSLLERLGFAVDVALVHTELGTLTQKELVKYLRKQQLPCPHDFSYVICRGRASDDGAAATSEVEFSFLKLVALPPLFVLEECLGNRSLTKPDDDALVLIIKDWFEQSYELLSTMPQIERSEPDDECESSIKLTDVSLSEVLLEHRGGSWTTIPSIGELCRVTLPLPSLYGQRISIQLRALSRYQLITEWQTPVDSGTAHRPITRVGETIELETSRTIDFRPFYQPEFAPAQPVLPFGFSSPDRIDFVISHPPDEVDSRDNLLTATRTGFRHLGLTFRHRPADLDALQQVYVMKDDDTFPGTVRSPAPPTFASRQLNLFPNETAIALRHLPYYMEVALDLRGHYGTAAGSAEPLWEIQEGDQTQHTNVPPAAPFLRRRPSLTATRGIHARDIDGDGKRIEVEVPLVQHDDLLNDTEREALPNDWDLHISAEQTLLNDDEQIDVPIRYFPDLRCLYRIVYQTDQANGTPGKYIPLFEVSLPLTPGYRDLDDLVRDDAFAAAFSQVTLRPGLRPHRPPEQTGLDEWIGKPAINVRIRCSSDEDHPESNAFSVLIETRHETLTLDPEKIYVLTEREGLQSDLVQATT